MVTQYLLLAIIFCQAVHSRRLLANEASNCDQCAAVAFELGIPTNEACWNCDCGNGKRICGCIWCDNEPKPLNDERRTLPPVETQEPKEYCSSGVATGNVCCAASCGTCGGSGCGGRRGGSSKCCHRSITLANRKCESRKDTACIIPIDTDMCNWKCYLDRYPDLNRYGNGHFGNDLQSARAHYLLHGEKEGRDCTCSPPTAGPTTSEPTPLPTPSPTNAPTTEAPTDASKEDYLSFGKGVVVQEEGPDVGSLAFTTVQDCFKACDESSNCRSFAKCDNHNKCYLKSKKLTGTESTRVMGICTTYYRHTDRNYTCFKISFRGTQTSYEKRKNIAR